MDNDDRIILTFLAMVIIGFVAACACDAYTATHQPPCACACARGED